MFVVNTEKFRKTKISYIFKNIFILFIIYSKCDHKYEKIFKKEESIQILKILGLINNIEEYQKIYIKYKSKIYIKKYR